MLVFDCDLKHLVGKKAAYYNYIFGFALKFYENLCIDTSIQKAFDDSLESVTDEFLQSKDELHSKVPKDDSYI